MPNYRSQFDAQRNARQAGDLSRSEALLDDIHRQAHAEAMTHLRVHYEGLRLRLAQRRFAAALKEAVALGFAAPASWVQKYLGLVRPNL